MKKDQEALFELGRQAVDSANFHNAIETFEQFLAHDERNSPAWFYLGLSYLESGYIHRAIEALNKAIEFDAQQADAYCLLGTAMSAVGELDRALEHYQAALAIHPQHAQAGEFLAQTKRLMASRTHYRNAMKFISGAGRKNGWVSYAMPELIQSMAIFPSSPARADLTRCVVEILAPIKNAPALIKVSDPDTLWARYCTEGYQALQREDWAAAVEAFGQALARQATDPVTHHALGVASYRSGDYTRAVQAWLRALELDPTFDFMRLLP